MSEFDISKSVLDPPIILCAGNCYRLLDKEHLDPKEDVEHEGSPRNIFTEPMSSQGEMFELVLPDIQKCFFKYIIGKKGETIRKLSREYKVIIDVPSNSDEYLKIKSIEKDCALKAKEFIENIVQSNRSRISPNYFISIPMFNSEISTNFLTFKNTIISDSECKGISERLFVSENKLHVTVLMLNLFEENEKEKMILDFTDVFRVTNHELLNKEKLYLTVQSLGIMDDEPISTNILYANVSEPSNTFQNIVDSIYLKLKKHPFANDKFDLDSIKIHISLMKSYFDRKPIKDGSKLKGFDSTKILSKYKNYYFGKILLDNIQISARFTSDSHTGFYKSLHKINIT